MFRILLFNIFIFLFFTANAQIKLGITGGINLTTHTHNYADEEIIPEHKFRVAPKAGLAASYKFNDKLYLRSGFLYSVKGITYLTPRGMNEFIKHIYHYLEIPLNLIININGLEILTGPYFAFAIEGKHKTWKEESNMELRIKKVGYYENRYRLYRKRLDAGINLGIGYHFQKNSLNLIYSGGLINLIPEFEAQPNFNPADIKTTHSVFSITYTGLFN